MRLLTLLSFMLTLHSVSAGLGFSKYNQIVEGQSNTDAVRYQKPLRGNTAFLYVMLKPQQKDHSKIIADFNTFVDNYAKNGVTLVPRVRYIDVEHPTDSVSLLADVDTWVKVLKQAATRITIPVVQAGFIGRWGEWNETPFCKNADIKKQIANKLVATGIKVALRYPPDHFAMFPNSRDVTLHNDCIYDGGFAGDDGGTFQKTNGGTTAYWRSYAQKVAKNNFYGGEGCDNSNVAKTDWSNYTALCDKSKGLAAYIRQEGIEYLNTDFPDGLTALIKNTKYATCVADIEAALKANGSGAPQAVAATRMTKRSRDA